ncbi:hypothetical protein [Companilactobacillus nodensis]|uniref:Uncharacterized protein n=1 Tax=Companilactobacillus nodensis DSM 19682 = JCM 14932 = NBRC 107160 TaxID=1423775 RepID=A0A0R1KDT0_9LACO|nr:hypothetical protein [Companilactobacillus nodensis]KRK79049.1 hypothetical protein FD03_GL001412 [Companilactobacillus nodensis DSM 19682 = JCM 14932 = NBRC 107160]
MKEISMENLKSLARQAELEEIVEPLKKEAAEQFPNRQPKPRVPEEKEALLRWEKRRNGFKIGNI